MSRRRRTTGGSAAARAPESASRRRLPAGLPVALDADVRRFDGGCVLLGGDPGRVVRLRPEGRNALDALADGAHVDERMLALAAALVDGGLAHPRPAAAPLPRVTVVVPVRDRPGELDRCLAALGREVPVLVVDDGSHDPAAVASVARARGAKVLHLPVNVGPAGARNAGVAATSTPLVAFLDSDCVVPEGWLAALGGHFADPAVAAVAPRVRGGTAPRVRGGTTGAGRRLLAVYASERGPLDLGAREARVRPGGRVPYVPTAALLVRRAALDEVAEPDGAAFDRALRYGEDVDLVWRLHDAGWTVRYDPRTVVAHEEPDRWRAWLERRYCYGTSAAPLAQRHGERLTPLVAPPLPLAAWLLLAAGRPAAALAVAAVPAAALHQQLRRTAVPREACARTAVRVTGQGIVGTAAGLGGAGAVVTAPVLLALLGPRPTRRTAAVALLAPPLFEWLARKPRLDPVRWTAVRLVDDLAYALGVWRGCWSTRTTSPLRPQVARPR